MSTLRLYTINYTKLEYDKCDKRSITVLYCICKWFPEPYSYIWRLRRKKQFRVIGQKNQEVHLPSPCSGPPELVQATESMMLCHCTYIYIYAQISTQLNTRTAPIWRVQCVASVRVVCGMPTPVWRWAELLYQQDKKSRKRSVRLERARKETRTSALCQCDELGLRSI